MFINTNKSALNTERMLNRNQGSVATALQRLSSGLRINSAKDDAAGQAISERMTSNIRGLNMTVRNLNDGVSMLQTAEGGLAEVGNMIQRMRELAVYAANTATLSANDTAKIQDEVLELLNEVDHIAKNTKFNGISVLNDSAIFGGIASDDKIALEDGLKRTWLEQSENMITTYLGLTADNVSMQIVYDDSYDGTGGIGAYVSGTLMGDGTGRYENLEMHFDMMDFTSVEIPDATGQFDRLISHEMVHAVMNRTVNMQSMPTWFKEGVAEFLPGADENLNANSGGVLSATVSAWDSSALHYATGYAMVRYMHDEIINNGGNGIEDILADMAATPGKTFAASLATLGAGVGTAGWASEADVRTDFQGASGTAYITALIAGGTLSNADTGAIGGSDADGGGRATTSVTTIPDVDAIDLNPTNFTLAFQALAEGITATQTLSIHAGAGVRETIDVSFGASSLSSLGLDNIDLVEDANQAITKLDAAIGHIANQRAKMGAQQNRLQASISVNSITAENITSSRSRIMDADFAIESANLTKSQIVQQAGMAMLVQAQASSSLALDLLNQSIS